MVENLTNVGRIHRYALLQRFGCMLASSEILRAYWAHLVISTRTLDALIHHQYWEVEKTAGCLAHRDPTQAEPLLYALHFDQLSG